MTMAASAGSDSGWQQPLSTWISKLWWIGCGFEHFIFCNTSCRWLPWGLLVSETARTFDIRGQSCSLAEALLERHHVCSSRV